jgi:hypothetical protein
MRTNNFVVAVVLAAATGLTTFSINASAQDVTQGRTRAEVRAELAQAYADGWRTPTEYDMTYGAQTFQSTRTRADVKAEAAQARMMQAATSGTHISPEQ